MPFAINTLSWNKLHRCETHIAVEIIIILNGSRNPASQIPFPLRVEACIRSSLNTISDSYYNGNALPELWFVPILSFYSWVLYLSCTHWLLTSPVVRKPLNDIMSLQTSHVHRSRVYTVLSNTIWRREISSFMILPVQLVQMLEVSPVQMTRAAA